MIPLYSVWQGDEFAKNPCLMGTWGQVWSGCNKVELPLPWAKEYAKELSEISGLPVEVRNRNHRVHAKYGMEVK